MRTPSLLLRLSPRHLQSLLLAGVISLGGCASSSDIVGNTFAPVGNDVLLSRAAQALGVPTSSVNIVSLLNNGALADGLQKYRILVNGKSYLCQLTSRLGVGVSDASCQMVTLDERGQINSINGIPVRKDTP